MPHEVSQEGFADWQELLAWTNKQYKIVGGSLLIRFGDPHYTGGSVDHFHTHLIVGGRHVEGYQAIRAKVGWSNPGALS